MPSRQRANWRVDPAWSSLKAKWLCYSVGVAGAESITRQILCSFLSHILHYAGSLETGSDPGRHSLKANGRQTGGQKTAKPRTPSSQPSTLFPQWREQPSLSRVVGLPVNWV